MLKTQFNPKTGKLEHIEVDAHGFKSVMAQIVAKNEVRAQRRAQLQALLKGLEPEGNEVFYKSFSQDQKLAIDVTLFNSLFPEPIIQRIMLAPLLNHGLSDAQAIEYLVSTAMTDAHTGVYATGNEYIYLNQDSTGYREALVSNKLINLSQALPIFVGHENIESTPNQNEYFKSGVQAIMGDNQTSEGE